MVLVWNKPEQSILKQVPIVTDLPLFGVFKMVTDNSMIQATLEEADSLMVSLKQVKTRDDLNMVKKENIQNVKMVFLEEENMLVFILFLMILEEEDMLV